jgi:uncharacterized protein
MPPLLKQEKPNKCALVTGASSGIGLHLARLLKQKGYRLIVTGRNQEVLAKEFHQGEIITADLATEEGQQKVLDAIEQHAPDLVVNSAGLGYYGIVTADQAEEIIEVNVSALVRLTIKARDKLLQEDKPGVILNISSLLAFFPMPQMTLYAASKAFVSFFSEGLNEELKGSGIYVLTSCPGQVATDFRRRASHGNSSHDVSWLVLDPKKVALQLYQQIESKKAVEITGFWYRCLYWVCKVIPDSWIRSFFSFVVKKR